MYLLYYGPSRLDRAPIIVLATGIDTPSKNQKTGPMVQTYILRKDISPSEAVRSGADYSICGNCIHRGGHDRKRSCYVEVHKGPTSVWRSFAKKKPLSYPTPGSEYWVPGAWYGSVPMEIWLQFHFLFGKTYLRRQRATPVIPIIGKLANPD